MVRRRAYILILPSSPHEAKRHGSTGFQDIELHRGEWPFSFCTIWALALCQMYTNPSAFRVSHDGRYNIVLEAIGKE